jgi:hypothetical protein
MFPVRTFRAEDDVKDIVFSIKRNDSDPDSWKRDIKIKVCPRVPISE